MADNPTESPGTEGTDDQEMPLPEISEPSAGERTSGGGRPTSDPIDVDVLAEAVLEKVEPRLRDSLRPEVERTVQSVKDVRLSRFDDIDPDDVRLVADALKRNDNDPDKAAMELGVQAILEERRQRSQQPDDGREPSPPSETDTGMSETERKRQVKKILSDSGLTDEESQAVIGEWSENSFSSVDDSLADLTRRAIAKARESAPQPEPEEEPDLAGEGVIPSQGIRPVGGGDEEKQQAILQLYSQMAPLQAQPTANREQIAAIKKRLRDLGEDIE